MGEPGSPTGFGRGDSNAHLMRLFSDCVAVVGACPWPCSAPAAHLNEEGSSP